MGEGELAERAQTSVAPDGACAAASPPAVPGGGQQQAYEDSELLKDKDAVFQFLFELRAKMKQDLEEQRQLLQRIYKVQCGGLFRPRGVGPPQPFHAAAPGRPIFSMPVVSVIAATGVRLQALTNLNRTLEVEWSGQHKMWLRTLGLMRL